MTWRNIEFNPPPRKLREFAAIAGVLAGVWGAIAWHRGALSPAKEIILAIAGLVFLTGLLAPRGIRWLYVGLMIATFPIAFVVNYLVLAAVFYLAICPLAFAFRLAGRDVLALKLQPGRSHWKPVAAKTTASYFRQH